MGRPQDDELSGLRSELEGDPELADTFARLEPGPNSGRSTSGLEFADPLAGLVPLDPPEPSTKLRPTSSAPSLPKLHGEEEGDRDTPTQRYVKTLHDLPDPSTRRVASDPAPAAAESKPLRTPSSYIGRIPRAPVSSPGGAPAVPAGVPMRRPSAQNPMLSYSGSARSLPDSAPLNPMSPANRLAAPTESQAARTVPVPEGHVPFPNSLDERSRTSTLPGAKAVSDSQAVPSTAASPYVAPAPSPASGPSPFSASLEAQEHTDAGVSAPAEADGSGGDEEEGAPQKDSGRAAIYLAVGILSAAATLAVLLFVVRPMRAGAGAVLGPSAVSAPVVVAAPSVSSVAVGAETGAKGTEPVPQGSGAAASITADPVFVSGSASSPVVASALPSASAVVSAPSVPSSGPVTVVVPVPSPLPSASVKAHVPVAAPVPKPSASSPKPSSSKVSPIFDF